MAFIKKLQVLVMLESRGEILYNYSLERMKTVNMKKLNLMIYLTN